MNAVLSNKSPTYASKPYIKSKNTKIYNPQLNSAHCASFNKFYITKWKFLAQNNIKALFVSTLTFFGKFFPHFPAFGAAKKLDQTKIIFYWPGKTHFLGLKKFYTFFFKWHGTLQRHGPFGPTLEEWTTYTQPHLPKSCIK